MAKKRRRVPPKKAIPVKKVVLPRDAIVHVVIPKGVVPIVATDPHKGIVEIVPVKHDHHKRRSWWDILFGVETVRS